VAIWGLKKLDTIGFYRQVPGGWEFNQVRSGLSRVESFNQNFRRDLSEQAVCPIATSKRSTSAVRLMDPEFDRTYYSQPNNSEFPEGAACVDDCAVLWDSSTRATRGQ
jgi:hypothetical protein